MGKKKKVEFNEKANKRIVAFEVPSSESNDDTVKILEIVDETPDLSNTPKTLTRKKQKNEPKTLSEETKKETKKVGFNDSQIEKITNAKAELRNAKAKLLELNEKRFQRFVNAGLNKLELDKVYEVECNKDLLCKNNKLTFKFEEDYDSLLIEWERKDIKFKRVISARGSIITTIKSPDPEEYVLKEDAFWQALILKCEQVVIEAITKNTSQGLKNVSGETANPNNIAQLLEEEKKKAKKLKEEIKKLEEKKIIDNKLVPDNLSNIAQQLEEEKKKGEKLRKEIKELEDKKIKDLADNKPKQPAEDNSLSVPQTPTSWWWNILSNNKMTASIAIGTIVTSAAIIAFAPAIPFIAPITSLAFNLLRSIPLVGFFASVTNTLVGHTVAASVTNGVIAATTCEAIKYSKNWASNVDNKNDLGRAV